MEAAAATAGARPPACLPPSQPTVVEVRESDGLAEGLGVGMPTTRTAPAPVPPPLSATYSSVPDGSSDRLQGAATAAAAAGPPSPLSAGSPVPASVEMIDEPAATTRTRLLPLRRGENKQENSWRCPLLNPPPPPPPL